LRELITSRLDVAEAQNKMARRLVFALVGAVLIAFVNAAIWAASTAVQRWWH
jgi:CHASE3 domain sensor protein